MISGSMTCSREAVAARQEAPLFRWRTSRLRNAMTAGAFEVAQNGLLRKGHHGQHRALYRRYDALVLDAAVLGPSSRGGGYYQRGMRREALIVVSTAVCTSDPARDRNGVAVAPAMAATHPRVTLLRGSLRE